MDLPEYSEILRFLDLTRMDDNIGEKRIARMDNIGEKRIFRMDNLGEKRIFSCNMIPELLNFYPF